MAKDTTGELRKSLYGRSSVFKGSMETPTERIVYRIMYDAILSGENVVWLCLKETPGGVLDRFSSYKLSLEGLEERLWFVDVTITGDTPVMKNTLRCASLDYICLTMHVVEMLKMQPVPLFILDNIGILAALESMDVTVRIIKYLDARIIAAGGGFMTLIAHNGMLGGELELTGLMENIILVGEERINARAGNRELKIPFRFSGSELILGDDDKEKDLSELFDLTIEEKKKLESEVAEKANLYRELME